MSELTPYETEHETGRSMTKSPLKWHGGKSYLADWIISLMPPHTRYVEPYFGGGSVLLRKPCDGFSEHANDINGQLINFWWTLRDRDTFPLFQQRCEATPFSEIDFGYCKRDKVKWQNCIEAWKFFVRCRQSRQGLMKDYATPTKRTRRGMNENVSAWLSAIEGLPDVHERLKRVEIWNRPALDVIKTLDSQETLFYLDPPYLHETRSTTGEYGNNEMLEIDHVELLKVLTSIKGKFLLSGYRSELYDTFQANEGWTVSIKKIDNKASSAKSKQKKIECVWSNFQPEVTA